MRLLHAGVDTTVIALWLGHEQVDTTQIYLHADLALKERALARTTPPDAKPGRYRAPRHAPRLPRSALIMPTPTRRIRPPPRRFESQSRHNPDVGIVHGAALAIGARPDLLGCADQPGRTIGHDQPRRREPAADEIAAELDPVLLGLPRSQPHRNQLPGAVLGNAPGADHALLRAARPDREVDRVEEQHDQVDVVERAPTERLKPLVQLRADRRDCRLRRPPEPGLLAERLDVTHRQAAHEPADHQRLERVGPQQPLAVPLREQLRDERHRRLAGLRDLDPQLTLGRLHMPRPKPVAQAALALGPAFIASAAKPLIELLLDRPLNDQPSAQPARARTTSSAGHRPAPWTSTCRCSLVSPPTAVRCVSRRRPPSSSVRT